MDSYEPSGSHSVPDSIARRNPVWVLVLVLVGLFVVAQVLLEVTSPNVHQAARRAQCQNNLKQIGLALAVYHRQYGSFPPAFVADANGKPLYSWRVLILHFLELSGFAHQMRRDEAWDGPNNAIPTQTSLPVFDCPSDPQSAKPLPALTTYVAVVGPHTAWSATTPRKLLDFKNPSNTILVVESADCGIHWAEPRDLDIGQMPMAINPPGGGGISSEHPGGANALFADGHVEFLPDSTDARRLAEMLDVDGTSDQAKPDSPR